MLTGGWSLHFWYFNIKKRKSLKFPIYKPKVSIYLIYVRRFQMQEEGVYVTSPVALHRLYACSNLYIMLQSSIPHFNRSSFILLVACCTLRMYVRYTQLFFSRSLMYTWASSDLRIELLCRMSECKRKKVIISLEEKYASIQQLETEAGSLARELGVRKSTVGNWKKIEVR